VAGIQKIRNNSSGVIAKTIAGTIIVTFALFFGWGTVFTGSDVNNIAKVNGKNIDLVDLSFETRTQQYLFNQRYPGQDMDFDQDMLRTLSTNSLIRRELIVQYLDSLGVNIPDQVALKSFRDDDSFQIEGQYSEERFEAVVRSLGFTGNDYIKRVGQDLALDLWRTSLVKSEFVTEPEIKNILTLVNQTRDVSFVTYKINSIKEQIQPSEEQKKEFYQEDKNQFLKKAEIKLRYIELQQENLRTTIKVSEEEIKNEYSFYVDNFNTKPVRAISHIMLNFSDNESKEKAIKLAKIISDEARDKSNFLDLVQKHSEDEGTISSGGDLGVSDGSSFPFEFESAIKDMKVGEISKPILLDVSVHVLLLRDYKVPVPESYQDIKSSFQERLVDTKLEYAYSDLIDKAGDLIYSSNDLDDLSNELGVSVKNTEFFSKSSATSFFKNNEVQELIFSDEQLEGISDLIEIKDDLSIVIEVEEFNPAFIQDYEQVELEINKIVIDRLAVSKAKEMADQLVSNLETSNLEILANDLNLEFQSYKEISRDSSLLPQTALFDLFNISRGHQGKNYYISSQKNGDVIVLFLEKINEFNKEITQEEIDQFRKIIQDERSNVLLVQAQLSLQEDADIIFINSAD